jgi:hypothetical protein
MNALWLHLFVLAVAGWINRGQQQVIGYLLEENRVLREQLHGRRLRLTDTQRRRLAVRAKALGTRSRLAVRSARPAIRSASCVAPALPDLTVPRTLRSGSRRALLGAASGGSKRLAGRAFWGRERVRTVNNAGRSRIRYIEASLEPCTHTDLARALPERRRERLAVSCSATAVAAGF